MKQKTVIFLKFKFLFKLKNPLRGKSQQLNACKAQILINNRIHHKRRRRNTHLTTGSEVFLIDQTRVRNNQEPQKHISSFSKSETIFSWASKKCV